MMNYTACTRSSAARNWLRSTEINIHQPRIGFWICISTSFAWVFLVVLTSQVIAESYRFISGLFHISPLLLGVCYSFLRWCIITCHVISFSNIFSDMISSSCFCLSIYYSEGQTASGFFCLREVRIYLGVFSYSPGFNCPHKGLKGDQR